MKILSSSLIADWSDDPKPLMFNDTGNAYVTAWCKGVKFTGNVTAIVADADQWEAGIIQVLEHAGMTAKYVQDGVTTVMTWKQTGVPCYDSGNESHIPWYNLFPAPDGRIPRKDLTDGADVQTGFVDFPTMIAYKRLGDNIEGNASSHSQKEAQLTYLFKELRFRVYLAVRKKNTVDWLNVANTKLLRACSWSTMVEANGSWDSIAANRGFNVTQHKREEGPVEPIAADTNPATFLPTNQLVANATINC